MKRKILSVLAVLVSVLMSTVVLAACEKAPAGADSSGGSESGAESGENGELYEFVASEEAAAQVQGIAEVLGGYDFVGLSGVQST